MATLEMAIATIDANTLTPRKESVMDRKVKIAGISFMFSLSLSCNAIAAGAADLPDAKFDKGGNTFNLERLSAERFPIPEGGFTGRASRLKDSDPLKPVAVSVDWAKVRRTTPGGAKGLRLRYRYHNMRPGTGPGKVWLVVRGLATGADGKRAKNQEDWPIKIFETGNQWAEFYLPDVGLTTTSDWLELIFDPVGGLGEIDIKDGSAVPFSADESLDPSKYSIAMSIDVFSMLDGMFALASGGTDNVIRFPWKLNNPKLRLDSRKLSLRLDLPPGVKSLNAFDKMPSQLMPSRTWNGWYAPFFHLTTDLAPGSEVGEGTITAWYDGKPCSKPLKIKFAVEEPAVAKAVPKRYFNGGCFVSPEVEYSSASNYAAYAKAAYAAGLRGIHANERTHNTFKTVGPLLWDSGGAYYIANGFTIGTHPPTWNKCPSDQRFITLGKDGKLEPNAFGVCPSTVYGEKSYFRDLVVPNMRDAFSMRECLMENWEPNCYFGKGCFCRNCLAEFAAAIGKPESDVASDWPACVRTGGRYFEQALEFRAKQHGRLIKTLDKTVREIQGPKSKGFCPELVWTEVSGDMLEDPLAREVAAKEYVGSLEWLNAWGPYVCWNAGKPYLREKRRAVAEWVSAKVVLDNVRSVYGRNPRLVSFPSGMQGIDLVTTPEWLGLCMDSYFLNGWDGSLVYFVRGLDVRFWRKFAESTTRAAYYEDYVLDGTRRDDATALEPVGEYAAPCRQVSAYLRKCGNVSTLQGATYDRGGGRIVAAVNFWEEGSAFFRLATKGLANGAYTVVSDRETLWTKDDGGFEWTADELEKGIFAGVGAARTKVFEIRPAAEHAERSAKNRQTQSNLKAVYLDLKPVLEKEAKRDHEEESGRTNLCPDGLLVI